jgi:hypothetical protein
MSTWLYPLSIIIPWALALLVRVVVTSCGLILIVGGYRRDDIQEVSVDVVKIGLKVTFRVSSGVLMMMTGLASMLYIFVLYPKLLLLLPILGGVGAASLQPRQSIRRRYQRQRRSQRRPGTARDGSSRWV